MNVVGFFQKIVNEDENNDLDSAVLMGQSAGVINSLESIESIISTIVKDAETQLKYAAANIC